MRIDAFDLRQDHAQRVLLPSAVAGQRVFGFQSHRAHRVANLVRDLRGQFAEHPEAFRLREPRAEFGGLLLQLLGAPCMRVERIDDPVEIGLADIRQLRCTAVGRQPGFDPREIALPAPQRDGERRRDRENHREHARKARRQQLAVPAERRAGARQHPDEQARSGADRTRRRDHGILRALDRIRRRGTRRGGRAQRAENQRRFRVRHVALMPLP